MKKLILLLSLVFLTSFQINDVNSDLVNFNFRKIDHGNFKEGEELNYVIHYGIIDAGVAKLELKKEDFKINGREVYHCVGTGRSISAFDWFFKVRDKYETYIDVDDLINCVN